MSENLLEYQRALNAEAEQSDNAASITSAQAVATCMRDAFKLLLDLQECHVAWTADASVSRSVSGTLSQHIMLPFAASVVFLYVHGDIGARLTSITGIFRSLVIWIPWM